MKQSVIQFILCSCQLTRTEKQKIPKCQKYSQQKIAIAKKRKKYYAEVEPAKKKLHLDTSYRYYYNEKQDILSGRAEKYKSMSASIKITCWPKEDRLIKKWEMQKKNLMLARKRTERSNARQLNAIMQAQ